MKKEYDVDKAKHGPVVPTLAAETRITIRLDDDILEWFRQQFHSSGGGHYQSLINAPLRDYIKDKKELLEETL